MRTPKVFEIVHLTPVNPKNDSRVLRAALVGRQACGSPALIIGPNTPVSVGVSSLFEPDNFVPIRSNVVSWLQRRYQGSGSSSSNQISQDHIPSGIRFVVLLRLTWRIIRPFYLSFRAFQTAFSRTQISRIQVVHVHDYEMLMAGVWIKLVSGSRLIYDAHELEDQVRGIHRLESSMIRRIEKICWRHIDHFLTVSEGIQRIYLSRFGNVSSEVVLNSPTHFKPSDDARESMSLRDMLEISPQQSLFVHLGYLTQGRGIEKLVRAFESLNHRFQLAFVGTGPLEKEIVSSDRYGLNIHVVPPVPHEEVVSFIQSADFGLCLIEPVSLSDTLCIPNKLLECLQAGLPVIASDLPEIALLVRKHHAGIVTDVSSLSIRESVVRISSSEWKLVPQMVASLSWDRQAEKLRNLYSTTSADV